MSKPPADADNEPHKIIDESAQPASQQEREKNEAAEELSQASPKQGETGMQVKVHSPYNTYYDGPAFSISADNRTGPFDVLPGHHNFITLLDPCEMVVRSPKGDQKIQIGGGIMHVKADQVIVFLDV